MAMKLISTAFDPGGMIPDRYSLEGSNISPQLSWTGAPDNAKSFALIVDDPDAPSGTFVHWLAYHIPTGMTELKEGQEPAAELSNGIRQGRNGFGSIGYGG